MPASAETGRGAGLGIERQVADCRELCHRRELEPFIDLVERHRVDVATVRGGDYDLSTATGRMQARIIGAVAQHESERESERMKRALRQRAERGLGWGGKRPFGFVDQSTINPAEAGLVQEAARRALLGEPIRSIVRDWNRRGIPTVYGGPWRPSVLRAILVSARISGRREIGRRTNPHGIGVIVGPAVWPAIIDPVESDHLRALLGDPARDRRPGTIRSHLLTGGLTRCGECGTALRANLSRHRTCNLVCPVAPDGCGRVSISEARLEAFTIGALVTAIDLGALQSLQRQNRLRPDPGAELIKVRQQLETYARQFAAGDITADEWRVLRETWVERSRQLERQVADQLPGMPPLPAGSAQQAWDSLSLHERRAVVRRLTDGIIVHRHPRGRSGSWDPARIEIRWRA
jgi:site-specific DNA recombinase